MINLVFLSNREVLKFEIKGRVVRYSDKNWKNWIQIYPLDRLFVKKLTLSRKPSLSSMGLLIIDANNGKNLEQYNDCKTEKDLAEMIRKDCQSKGIREA